MIPNILLLAATLCGTRAPALDASAWAKSQWISASDQPVYFGEIRHDTRAADGTSWFVREVTCEKTVTKATWMTAGLGVYEVYVNGKAVGDDFLKPGFTHPQKTKYAFTYDVTALFNTAAGAKNVLAAESSHGWWSDKIVSPGLPKGTKGHFSGKKPAFRGVLELVFADGTRQYVGTDVKTWKAGVAGPVTHAAIFDGEEHDARMKPGYADYSSFKQAEANEEFKGEVLPTDGAEIVLRHDLAMTRGPYSLKKGKTLLIDFGQNCAGVPFFRFKAKAGTVLTCLPGEMVNDADKGERGCDGPKGTLYRANLRMPEKGMRLVYTFAGTGDWELYHPRFTFFGYRYVSLTATDDVEIASVASVPVTSITKAMEIGRIETGDKDVNRLIANVYWGQLSNYLSVPTDCPQRNERLGWTADTQVFCEAGSFNANTLGFFRKWMRDMRDSQHADGGFPGVAPGAQYGNEYMRLGWADAGVIVPYKMWLQFGDRATIDANWAAMEKFVARAAATRYQTPLLPECNNYQWNDWLSLTKYESCPFKPEYAAFERLPDNTRRVKPDALAYWNYLGGCYWAWDAGMMAEMAEATGRADAAVRYRNMEAEAKAYLRRAFFGTADGSIAPNFRGMQTAYLFALKLGLVEGAAKERAIAELTSSIAASGGTLHTGFLGTSIAMDTLTENGLVDLAYALLLNHKFPGWLYSVDQGATTIWERWNSYTKKDGFGPVGMNSFNHYAYGSVLAWIYKTAAGIRPDAKAPGYRKIVLKPVPDRRLGFVKASYKSAAGLVKSAWRYEGEKWIWEFAVPQGVTASVWVPGAEKAVVYGAGEYRLER